MIEFVSASKNDIAEIQNLAKIIWHESFPRIISIEQIEFMLPRMYDSQLLEEEIKEGMIFEKICFLKEAIGYVAYCLESETNSVKISKLYLLAKHQCLGIGQEALKRILNYAVTCRVERVYLYVNKKNKKAMRAYEKAGFTIEESICQDVGGGFYRDDYKMIKHLSIPSHE